MAINVSFNGATIYKPGAYSRTQVDLSGNVPLGAAGLIAIFGEADAGAPGSAETNIADNYYTADRLVEARNKYRSGPIVDALNFLFSPAADGAIPNGASIVWVYKTNASVRASLALSGSYGTIRSSEWGVGGNQISAKILANSESVPSKTGSVPAAFGAALNGASFSARINGGAAAVYTLSTTSGDHADIATLVAELAALLPAAFDVSASSGALRVQLDAASTQFQLGWGRSFELIDSTPGDLAKLGLTAGLVVASSEPSATITLNQKRDLLVESDTLGGNVVMSIGRDPTVGSVTSASVSVTLNTVTLTDSAGSITFDKAAFVTLKQLAESISLQPGWSAEVASPVYNQLGLSVLDRVSVVGALGSAGTKPARLKKDAYEVQDFFAQSNVAGLVSPAFVGLPAALTETLLSGGAKGPTVTNDIVNALSKFEKFHANSIVPLFSRDATADIADNLTDASSTYTIDGIHQAVKTHISLMKTTKRKSERQGYLSFKGTYSASKDKAGNMADARLQMMIQDVRQSNAQGVIQWFQPWAMACLVAGARGGAPIGLPLTFKFMNCSGIRQTSQPMSTPEADIVVGFDPDTQYDDAILSGLTFMEAPRTGGFRVVVDNTTYGIDDNWVYNRANVLYASDIVAYNFRNIMENRYVGVKNTILAAEVKGTAESVLATFLAQGITVSTDDAPQGFKDLSVRIDGSTIYITVTIKLVEGIDFILADITLQRATQTA
jgi:hypothetical protein